MEILLIWIVCAFVTAIIASNKGRGGGGWFFIGLILGIFGIILIACLPPVQKTPVLMDPPNKKDCPDCGEEIMKVANVCKHCGYRFDKTNAA